MYQNFQSHLQSQLADIREAGLYKNERIITTPQGAAIQVAGGEDVLNFCANNYLGLSNDKRLIAAAKKALDERGYGMSSVRFICGTQDLHKELEAAIARFFGTEDTILYAACFDANGGVFEPLLTEEDAIISDALNHASIIDGVRLCKAKRYRYANADMAELEARLQEAQAQRFRLIVTDGVFSMDGNVAPLDKIYALAEKYNAMVMVDESHSAGVVGRTGRGVTELYNLRGKVEILTGTLGKAFGGAIGLHANTDYFVKRMLEAGFDIKPTQSAICAVMLYDAKLSQDVAARLQDEGIYVTGFYYPVVPKGEARIRVQISAAHEREHLDKCVAAFTKVGKELGVIK